MKNWQTKNGYQIFQVLKGRSNSYLICVDNKNILVDTGKQSAFEHLQKNIRAIKQNHIDFLILTHTHYDHCENAHSIQEKYKCIIIVSKYEAESAANGFTVLPKGTFAVTKFISNIGNLIGKRWFAYKTFDSDILVDEEFDLREFGLNVRLINTNGHSKGSICIIVDNEIVLVGDTLLGSFLNTVFPPFADDISLTIQSWLKLLETGCNLFLPGHGKEIKRTLLHKEYEKYRLKYL